MSRFFISGLTCLDVFSTTMILSGGQPVYQRTSAGPGVARSKEEREAFENFASIFIMMEPHSFQMLIAENIKYFVERISMNPSFQAIANSFLISPNTSSKFGQVLVKFLMKKLPELASSSEKSTLYLKMFRLVFSAVSSASQQASTDNENMLKVIKNKFC